jgi:hypothetical protein
MLGKGNCWRNHDTVGPPVCRGGDAATATPDSAPQRWDALPQVRASAVAATSLHYGPTSHVVAAVTPSHITLCQEASLQVASRPPHLALQTSAQQVAVYHARDGVVRLASGLRLAGLDVSSSHLVMWNRDTVEVFPLAAPDATRAAAFEAKAPAKAIALSGATLHRAVGRTIEAVDMTGAVQGKVDLPDAVVPEWLLVEGDDLVVVSQKTLLVTAFKLQGALVREVAASAVRSISKSTCAFAAVILCISMGQFFCLSQQAACLSQQAAC